MDSEPNPDKTLTKRHKCSACFKQYKKKEHLVEHMRDSYHSVHQPKCKVCQKHCKTFESLREHLTGPLSKGNCSKIFVERGCSLCLNLFESLISLEEHLKICKVPAPSPLEFPYRGYKKGSLPDHNYDTDELVTDFDMLQMPCTKVGNDTSSPMEGVDRHGFELIDGEKYRPIEYNMENNVTNVEKCILNEPLGKLTEKSLLLKIDHHLGFGAIAVDRNGFGGRDGSNNLFEGVMCDTGYSIDFLPTLNKNYENTPNAVAMDCELVGGGSDGSLDICARVCLIDENENVIFHAFIEPLIPVTNYRYDITGITEEHLKDAMPLKEVQEKILQILYKGESIVRARLNGGKARLLVGHDVGRDLDCLRLSYPDHLLRDTARYQPIMKTNLVSHSLKYLTLTYLGYEIQSGMHDPFIDCVSTMRLYTRIRDQDHTNNKLAIPTTPKVKPNWGLNNFDARTNTELETMTPDELFQNSSSNYKCWCLDRADPSSIGEEEREASVQQTPWPAWPIECPLRIISF